VGVALARITDVEVVGWAAETSHCSLSFFVRAVRVIAGLTDENIW
jgi:hypothetical protein